MEMRLPDFGPVRLFELQFIIARPLSAFSKPKGFRKKNFGLEYWATFDTDEGEFPVGLILQTESDDLTLVVLTGGWMVPIVPKPNKARVEKLTELWHFVLSHVREWRADVELRYRVVRHSDEASPLGTMSDAQGEMHITNITFERKTLQPSPYRIVVSLISEEKDQFVFEDKFCHGTLASVCSDNAEAVLERIMTVVQDVENAQNGASIPIPDSTKPKHDYN